MGQEVAMVEIAGKVFRAVNRHPSGWWIHMDGMSEWWDSPEARFDVTNLPNADGAFEPEQITLGPRTFAFKGRHEAASSEWADLEVRSWAASIATVTDLQVRVFTAGRWLYLRRAKVRGKVRSREVTETISEFQIPIWSHDPLKYGRTRTVSIDALTESSGGLGFPIVDGGLDFNQDGATLFPGVFHLENPGTAAFFPERFEVEGPLAGFTITSESHTVHYDGPVAAGQTLTLSPYAGGRASIGGADVSHNLIEADWVPVDPGTTRGFLFTPVTPGPGARLTVTYPEGAWL